MIRMWNIGHNTKKAVGAATLTAAMIAGAVAPAASAQPESSAPFVDLRVNGLSSQANIVVPQLPDIEVPRDVVEGAKRVGITLPERIELSKRLGVSAPQAEVSATERDLVAASEEQLIKEGHRRDDEAQRIAAEWAAQAARGEVKFNGNVGRGNTATELGTGQIYRLNPTQAAERITWLRRDEVNNRVTTNPVKEPKRFGVATARDGETVYLVEYFLN